MPNTFETPTWLKREGLRLYFGVVGLERLADAIPDDSLDDVVANIVAADEEDEEDEGYERENTNA